MKEKSVTREATVSAEPLGAPQARLPSGPIGRLLASIGNLSYILSSVHCRYAQERGLGVRGVWTLSAISEGHTTPGAIARLMLLPPSVISGDLAQLIESAMIVRRRDDADGRRLVYSLTEAGREVLAGAHAEYVALLKGKLDSYDRSDLDRLLRMLFDVSLHLRSAIENPPGGEGL
jgi:DNA-binding MarR family transcriptional regulator